MKQPKLSNHMRASISWRGVITAGEGTIATSGERKIFSTIKNLKIL